MYADGFFLRGVLMLSVFQAFTIGIFSFNGASMVALLVISIVVIAIVFYAIRDYIKEHPKRAIAITLVGLILLAGGAFAWKYVGPALDKYLTHTVDQSINQR